ncbi:hypothetical protein SLA2020_151240 [Shorea laevis]
MSSKSPEIKSSAFLHSGTPNASSNSPSASPATVPAVDGAATASSCPSFSFSSSSRLPPACFTWHSDPNYFATKTLVFYLKFSSNIYCNRSSVPKSKRTMFKPQHFVDLQENSSFGDQNSWLSGKVDSSPTNCRIQSSLSNSTANGNVGRILYNDLVEMIPLVQSLIVILSLSVLEWICI